MYTDSETRTALDSYLRITEDEFFTLIKPYFPSKDDRVFRAFVARYHEVKKFLSINPKLEYHTIQNTRSVIATLLYFTDYYKNLSEKNIIIMMYALLYQNIPNAIEHKQNEKTQNYYNSIYATYTIRSLDDDPYLTKEDTQSIFYRMMSINRRSGIVHKKQDKIKATILDKNQNIVYDTDYLANDAYIAGITCASLASCHNLHQKLNNELERKESLTLFYRNNMTEAPFISKAGQELLQPLYEQNYHAIESTHQPISS